MIQAPEPTATWMGKSGGFKSLDHHWTELRFATAGDSVDLWDHARAEPTLSYQWGADSINCVRREDTSVVVFWGVFPFWVFAFCYLYLLFTWNCPTCTDIGVATWDSNHVGCLCTIWQASADRLRSKSRVIEFFFFSLYWQQGPNHLICFSVVVCLGCWVRKQCFKLMNG